MATEPAKPVYVTVGFKCADEDAFRQFWADAIKAYHFGNVPDPVPPVVAFAVSMGNMFEEQDVVDAIMSSDVDAYDKEEAISAVPCNQDLRGLCAQFGIAHPYDREKVA